MYFIINIRIWNNQILSLNVYLCWFASLEVRTIFPHCYKSDLLILYLWQHRTFQECNTVVIIYLALKDIFNPLFVFSTKCREKKPDLLPLYNNLTVNNENSLILLLSIMVTFKYKKKPTTFPYVILLRFYFSWNSVSLPIWKWQLHDIDTCTNLVTFCRRLF